MADRIVLTDGGPGTNHDVRDPKVWFDAEARLYRMVLGASVDGDPAILLHSSPDGESWSFTSVLYRAPPRFREGGARCAECPDFFKVDGHWVLVAGFVGFTEPETKRHNLIYAISGTFADGVFTPYSDELQELDFGTDFYAMQSFADGDRQLALAWLFNWEFRKPAGSSYSGEMSLPRILGVDANRRLTMRPEPRYQALRAAPLKVENGDVRLANPDDPVELALSGDLAGLIIRLTSSTGGEVEIAEAGGRLFVRAPEDDGRIIYRSAPLALTGLTIFFDRGVVEIFANEGAVCGTRRSYGAIDAARLTVTAPGVHRVEAWRLASGWDGQ
jgi:beta-fructofuranosidase